MALDGDGEGWPAERCWSELVTRFSALTRSVQNVLPPGRSAEGTSVMLICLGGIAVVAAAAVIEAAGDQRATGEGIGLVLVAALLLLAGVVTLATESSRLRARN